MGGRGGAASGGGGWRFRAAVVLLLVLTAGAGTACHSTPMISPLPSWRQRIRLMLEAGAPEVGQARWRASAEPSISNAVAARWGNMKRPPARQGLTLQDAESLSASAFPGVHRHAAPHVVMATADAQSNLHEPRKKSTVRSRARAAVTRPWLQAAPGKDSNSSEFPNQASGAPSAPLLTVGSLVLAQTFEGATATSTSDAMPVPSGSNAQRGQAVAVQLQTSRPVAEYRAASSAASFATTAQPVKSLAASGPANYKFAIAQADQAVALSHIQRSSHGALPANLRRQAEAQGRGELVHG